MAMKQLDTLYKYEVDKEKQCAQLLQSAEQEYQQNKQRLSSVGEYRLEYMKRLNDRSAQGMESYTFSHYHAFISKLDHASQQVKIALNQAKALVTQRRKIWLEQRQKVQAVTLLRDKKLAELTRIENRREQKMFDELSTQQFTRKNRRSY